MKRIEKDRQWQERFGRKCYEKFEGGGRNYLLQATMGAGKTRAALKQARRMLDMGWIARVVVVTRSTSLRTQWVQAAAELGIQLEGNWGPFDYQLTGSFVGMVITYQKLANDVVTSFFEKWCSDHLTLVILDEPHHMSEELDMTWGEKAIAAFAPAAYRLLITATPWRSDGSRIPFVEYDQDGLVKADFTYSYTQAILDNVCRMAFFQLRDGSSEYALNGEVITHENLRDVLANNFAKVCACLFKPGSGWMTSTIDAAHDELIQKRLNGHPDAGALIVVSRTDQARQIADMLRKKVGRDEVVLATSDLMDEDGEKAIKRFKDGKMMWLVAVGMVSEGVDIPRLRVGVYASTVRTVLMFRQFVGRFIRMIGDLDDLNEFATIFIAMLDPWVGYAEEMEAEVRAAIREEEVIERKRTREYAEPLPFIPLSSTGVDAEVVASGQSISQEEISKAAAIGQRMGIHVEPKGLALFARQYGINLKAEGDGRANDQPVNKSEERKSLRQTCSKLGRQYVIRSVHPRIPTQQDFEAFFGQTIPSWFGVLIVKASNEQLIQIRQRLAELLTRSEL